MMVLVLSVLTGAGLVVALCLLAWWLSRDSYAEHRRHLDSMLKPTDAERQASMHWHQHENVRERRKVDRKDRQN